MADGRARLYRPSERDWPALLHIVVASRQKARTTAWAQFVDTRPPNDPQDRLKVVYSSDAYITTPEGLIGVVRSLTDPLVRQHELRKSVLK